MSSEVVRARLERFGAWVRADDRTLLALDREATRALGIEGGARWQGPQGNSIEGTPSAPIEVHVAVTTRCPATCTGCYLEASPEGSHVAFEELRARLDAVADAGVFTVAFGGGEPRCRERRVPRRYLRHGRRTGVAAPG